MGTGEDNELSSSFKTIRPLLESTYFIKRVTAYGLRVGPMYSCTLSPGPNNTNTSYLSLKAPSTVQRSSTSFLAQVSESYSALLSARGNLDTEQEARTRTAHRRAVPLGPSRSALLQFPGILASRPPQAPALTGRSRPLPTLPIEKFRGGVTEHAEMKDIRRKEKLP